MADSTANQMAAKHTPRVSIIIPTHNRAPLLKNALHSVLAQTFQGFEVIVIDDGFDDTANIVSAYSQRVLYVRIRPTRLPAVARNVGLQMAQGEYIGFLDSDDQWLPQKLERQIEILDKYPSVGLVCSNALVLKNGQDKLVRLYLREDQGRSGWVLKELLKDNFVITSTAVIRRSLLNRVGIFSEDPLLRVGEDYDLWLRISALSEIYYIDEALAIYRDHPNSIRAQESRVSYWQGMLLILQRLRQSLTEWGCQDAVTDRLIRDLAYMHRCRFLEAYWHEAQYLNAAKCALQLMSHRPIGFIKFGYKLAQESRFMTAIMRERLRKDSLRGEQGEEHKAGEATEEEKQGLKLHLGCGEIYLPGYVNIDLPVDQRDVKQGITPDLYADVRYLKYPEESVAEIRLHHVFEHFDRPTALRLLIDWYLCLKDGGQLIIETPDFERCAQHMLERRFPLKQQMLASRHIFGSQEVHWAYHRDAWYRSKFSFYLQSLGFTDLKFRYSKWKDTFNITVIATKRRPFKTRDELLQAAENILRLSLVDESEYERHILEVWLSEIR